jgi:hypothetical protein
LRNVEAALGTEVDVDQHDVEAEGQRLVDGSSGRRCDADDGDAVFVEELPGGLEERRAVVDDQTRERHAHAQDRRGRGCRRRRRVGGRAVDVAPSRCKILQ